MAGKQAKTLTAMQVRLVLSHLSETRYPTRNQLMFLLSVRAGLRAKEIACLSWPMVLTAEGDVADRLHLEDRASKGRSGRVIPLAKELRSMLIAHHESEGQPRQGHVIRSERGRQLSAASVTQWFHHLYRQLGFVGCSSHSGRRTFITATARKISLVGGSLRDVQLMAGHASLAMTARYIEGDSEAMRKVVDLV